MLETMGGGGIALFDCDNDGKLDMAVVNDSTIDQYLHGGDPMVTLYHQDTTSGQDHFTDVTQSAGLTTRGWGMGIAVGDFDDDGLPDLYVTGYGHNVLYHNLGGCKFEDVRKKPAWKSAVLVLGPPGRTTIGMDILICSLPAMLRLTRVTCLHPTRRQPATVLSSSRYPTR